MDKKIQKFLETNNIKFESIKHRKVYTAFNSAETQHINPKEVVKTVLVKFDKQIAFLTQPGDKLEKFNLILVAIPAGKHLDFKKIDKFVLDVQTKLYKKLIKMKPEVLPRTLRSTGVPAPIKVKSSIAKEKDIAGKLKTKYLLAPLPIYDTPLLMDKKLTLVKNLVFSAGSFTESVKVPAKTYLKAVTPILGSFGK